MPRPSPFALRPTPAFCVQVPLPAGVVCPRGWDSFEALTTGTYALYNSTFSLNCGPSTPPLSGQYQTDLIRDKALAYIECVRAGAATHATLGANNENNERSYTKRLGDFTDASTCEGLVIATPNVL